MTASTFDSTGLSLIRYPDILQNAIDDAKASWDESVDTTINDAQDAFLGHLLRNISLVINDINEIVQGIYDSGSHINSTGARLDHLYSLLGIKRPGDVASTAVLTLTSDRVTSVAAGSQYKTASGLIFATDVILAATVGSNTVASTCTIYGPNNADPGDIDTIVTSTPGITAVTNAAAAVPGRLRAEDSEQKAAHTVAVSTSGLNDDASIYEALIGVTGVSGVSVNSNDTEATVDSVPSKHLHCVVIGGSDADIAEAIADNKIGSQPTHGATTVPYYNEITSQSKDINFDRGTAVPIYIEVGVTLIEGQYPDDYETQIRDNLITHFADFKIGDDVIYTALYGPLYLVPGIVINTLKIDTTAVPVGVTDEVMSGTQLATFTLADAATHLSIV